MFEIIIYAFGIMYSAGPVNFLALGGGIKQVHRTEWLFCLGVGTAMLMLCLLLGLGGSFLIDPHIQRFIGIAGVGYIAWLAWSLLSAAIRSRREHWQVEEQPGLPGFRAGLLMQLLNPKAFIALLPITTIQFPQAGVTDLWVIPWSIIIGLMAAGAPGIYLVLGWRLGKLMRNSSWMFYLNIIMAVLLFYVAFDIGADLI